MVHLTFHLALGKPVSRKVAKQCAHIYAIRITEKEAHAGIVCRVQSAVKSKFKLLYSDRDENSGLNLALQVWRVQGRPWAWATRAASQGPKFIGALFKKILYICMLMVSPV